MLTLADKQYGAIPHNGALVTHRRRDMRARVAGRVRILHGLAVRPLYRTKKSHTLASNTNSSFCAKHRWIIGGSAVLAARVDCGIR